MFLTCQFIYKISLRKQLAGLYTISYISLPERLPVILSRIVKEHGPMVLTEVVTATSTEYSALGAKSWSITLVVEVLTVVCSPLPVFNLYLTV